METENVKIKKPPYRVPTMPEIAASPRLGLNCVSTFSGGGGSSLGYRMSGFSVRWANEFVAAAAETYRANFPDTVLDTRDIREITAADVLTATNLSAGEIDLLDGSPPCASFSMCGKREKDWGATKTYSDTTQRTDDLFFEFARLLKELQPKTFVAENVAGLLYGTAKGYFREILTALKSCGYRVTARLLDSQWLNVPQSRQRVIFVGIRADLPFDPVHPKPFSYRYTLRDAFGGADEIAGDHQTLKPGTKLHRLWQWSIENKKPVFDDAHFALYGKRSMFNQRRTDFDQPAPTILQGSQCIYHPTLPRTLTIPELKRISSFPDDFRLTGGFAAQWERIGRAVPPVMMSHVAACLRDLILLPNLRREM